MRPITRIGDGISALGRKTSSPLLRAARVILVWTCSDSLSSFRPQTSVTRSKRRNSVHRNLLQKARSAIASGLLLCPRSPAGLSKQARTKLSWRSYQGAGSPTSLREDTRTSARATLSKAARPLSPALSLEWLPSRNFCRDGGTAVLISWHRIRSIDTQQQEPFPTFRVRKDGAWRYLITSSRMNLMNASRWKWLPPLLGWEQRPGSS